MLARRRLIARAARRRHRADAGLGLRRVRLALLAAIVLLGRGDVARLLRPPLPGARAPRRRLPARRPLAARFRAAID
jgi:hypothetical protein